VVWLLAKLEKAVTKHGKNCQTITPTAPAGLDGWFEAEGVVTKADRVILFKRVSADFKTQEGTTNETLWAVGSTVTHPAWSPKDQECGPGKFHAVSRPYFADAYRDTRGDRYIAIRIAVKDLYAWPSPSHEHKIAFREGVVLHECNRLGKQMEVKS
jgi:hypothetical protein